MSASSSGSRTAAYVVAGATATLPAIFVASLVIGVSAAVAAAVVAWVTGILWLLRKRQQEPGWDREMPTGR